MVEKLSAVDKSENKVELLGRLERKFERDNEGVFDLCKHRTLRESMSDLRP